MFCPRIFPPKAAVPVPDVNRNGLRYEGDGDIKKKASKPKSAAAARAGEMPTGVMMLVAARADAISTTPPPETQLLQPKSCFHYILK